MQALFNPSLEKILSLEGKVILFVHVGKCAGESIVSFLKKAIGESVVMCELHVDTANVTIGELSGQLKNEMVFLIAKRDPLQRFVSAFNWDKHNLYFAGRLKGTIWENAYEIFPTVNDLGEALSGGDQELRDYARRFCLFGHMGMGQAWYTPKSMLERISPDRIYSIDSRSVKEDSEKFMRQFIGYAPDEKLQISHTKADYWQAYENGEKLFPKVLSQIADTNIRNLLREDYSVYEFLSDLA